MTNMPTRDRRYWSQVLPLLSVLLVALPLAGSAVLAQRDAPRSSQVGHSGHGGHDHGGSGEIGHSAGMRTAAEPTAAQKSALRLQALLGQHSVLAADMMRGRVRGDEDFAQAANAALGKNTDEMTQLVQSLFGAEAANRFKSLWGNHVVALLNYARGLADQDNAVRDEARKSLTAFELDLGRFFSGAAQGRLTARAARDAVLRHVDHLLEQADAYAAQQRTKADQIYREAYRHTYHLGETLAAALLPAEQSAELKSATWRLRSELGRLLAEHVVLAVGATRAGLLNTGDFTTAAQAVNGNTKDLAAAMDSLFGASAAKAFQSMWADHIDALVAYVAGTAAQDTARRDEARRGLDRFEARFAAFLETATDKRLDSANLAQALLAHDQMLLRHVDAFAAKNYPAAYDVAGSTFAHMFDLAGQLADAFGATIAARLPVGGAETGEGGEADVVGPR
jgi:hypothetical protein